MQEYSCWVNLRRKNVEADVKCKGILVGRIEGEKLQKQMLNARVFLLGELKYGRMCTDTYQTQSIRGAKM
jgi:hypothetical protein